MGKHAQLVLGPAGSGKSTYVATVAEHCSQIARRVVHCFNLDPAAEVFNYEPSIDIRDLITVDDIQSELDLGPNGGLVYAIEFAAKNPDWLESCIGEHEDDYLIIDCPGQAELFLHVDAFKHLVQSLEGLGYRVCAVFLIDSQFMMEPSKFISGCLLALSAMCRLELPHINVLSKMDLAKDMDFGSGAASSVGNVLKSASDVSHFSRDGNHSRFGGSRDDDDDDQGFRERTGRRRQRRFRFMNARGGGKNDSSSSEDEDGEENSEEEDEKLQRFLTPDVDTLVEALDESTPERFRGLNAAIGQLLEEYAMVHFVPLDISNEDSVAFVLAQADNAMQYGEDVEPRMEDFEDDPRMGGIAAPDLYALMEDRRNQE